MNNPLIFSHKKVVFIIEIVCNKKLLTFDYVSRQKHFFNITWYKEKTVKHLFILSKLL